MPLKIAVVLAASASLIATNAMTRADEFVLTTGATIRGEWLNQKDRAASFYLISTEYGGSLQLDATRVSSVRKHAKADIDYARFAPRARDTVEDQWKLGLWCRQHELHEQAETHFSRVVELDPQHAQARRFLGYGEIEGRWITRKQHLESQGYVHYKGAWRLPEDIKIEKERRTLELARKGWHAKLKLWRSQFRGDKRGEALANIRRITDPLALEGIGKMLERERDRRVKMVYVEVLGQIEGDEATMALLKLALNDRDKEIFYACVEELIPRRSPAIVRVLAHTLKDSSNTRVNRAAHTLSELGDQTVISPLIDALVTTHRSAAPPSDATTTSFGSGPQFPGAGLQRSPSQHFTQDFENTRSGVSQGGCCNDATNHRVANQEVLKALARLTGVSFSFDQQAWRNWYAIQQRAQPGTISTRRSS